MIHSKRRENEIAKVQACGSQPHDQSQLPLRAGLTNVLAMRHQAGANEITNPANGAQTENPFDVDIDTTKTAQAAISYSPHNHQVSDMESVKALLRNFLDDIKGPQTERSSYLDGLLSQWLDLWRRDREYALLIYVLGDGSEQYKDRKLDFSDLETIDRNKTHVLEQQCVQQGACLHLAKMTSAVNIDPDDALGFKMAINIHEISDLNGGLLVDKPVTVGRESIIQNTMLKKRYQDSIAHRNPHPRPAEGTLSLQIDTAKSFQDWVLVLMPAGYRFKFLIDNADPDVLHDWINTQSAGIQPSEMDLAGAVPNMRWGLTLACKTQLKNIGTQLDTIHNGNASHQDHEESIRQTEMLGAVVRASLRLQDANLVQKAVAIAPRWLSLTMWEEVGSTMNLANFFSYRNSLSLALWKINSLQDRYIVLHSIRVGCENQKEPQERLKMIYDWIQDRIEQALNELEVVEENDGAILVLIAKKFAKAIPMSRIIAFAKKHSSNEAFVIEFAFSLYDALVENLMDTGFARNALAETLSAAIPTLCDQDAHVSSHHQGFLSSARRTGSVNASAQDQRTLQADRMARLLRCCLIVGLHEEERTLLRRIWQEASLVDAPAFQQIFLPYLRQLLIVMQDYSIPLTTQKYQWQFQQVISHFITRYIGKEPIPLPADLTCPPLGCANPTNPYGCHTCLELDAFLVDPHRRTADVTGGIDAPEHVAAQLKGTDYLQMTVVSHSAAEMRSRIRITKNMTKAEEPNARHNLWKERVVKANESIQAICGDEEWKMLLGDRYDECMGLKAVRAE